jgi:hypothetical protein
MMFGCKKCHELEARVVSLEKTIGEMTALAIKARDVSVEMDRLLPPLREALQIFQKFNATY